MRVALLGLAILLTWGYWVRQRFERPLKESVTRSQAARKKTPTRLQSHASTPRSAPKALAQVPLSSKAHQDELTEEMLQQVADYLQREKPEEHRELMERYLQRRARFERKQGVLIQELVDITNQSYDETTEVYDRKRFRELAPTRELVKQKLTMAEERYESDLKQLFGEHYEELKTLEEDFAEYAEKAHNLEVLTIFPL